MNKSNIIIEIIFWISSILNCINLFIVFPYYFLCIITLPLIFFIYGLIISIIVIISFLKLHIIENIKKRLL